MMSRIYLVQHGEAASKAVDPERPLTTKGMAEITAMAHFLKRAGVPLTGIRHSGKLRAEQSAGILAQSLLNGAVAGSIKHINPNDPVQAFAGILETYGSGTMFVGHLPFMEKLLAYLVCGSEAPELVQFTPGTVVCLADDGDGWRVEWMIRPELIL
jgi:phosphohistidine phosphatase